MPKAQEIDRSVFLSDLHYPYEDKRATSIALDIVEYSQPTHVFLLGDVIDFYQLSRFNKDPRRALELQADLDKTLLFFGRLRKAAPDAELVYLEGNHEARLLAYQWQHPETCNLRCMEPEKLLGLEEFKIRWVPEKKIEEHHGFILRHGSVVRKHAGQSARGELEKWGTCGISGHTHRVGCYTETKFSGVTVWFENGCLCDLRPEYLPGVPNWQHALHVGEFIRGDNRFQLRPVNIVKRKALYDGQLFD
jgi:predicted phosphodiesterase